MKSSKIVTLAALVGTLFLGLSDTAQAQQSISVSPASLTFSNVPANSVSNTQVVTVTSQNGSTTVVANLTNAPSWLKISNSIVQNTPATFNVYADTTGLSAGTYAASLTIQVQNLPSASQTIPVSLTVGATSALTANPATLSFSATQGATTATPSVTTVQLLSSAGVLNYNLTSQSQSTNTNFIQLNATSGSTNSSGFQVSVNPTGLPAGVYKGTITAASTTTNDSVQIPVTLTVSAGATLNVTPSSPITFLYQSQSGTVPSPQSVMVSTTAGSVGFTATLGSNSSYLIVSPTSGTATTTAQPVTLSVAPGGLNPGTYTTNLTIAPVGGSSAQATVIPVTLIVSNSPLLKLSSTTLSFSAPFASNSTQTGTVSLTSTGAAVPFNVTTDSTAPWLTVTPTSGSTPATLTISVNPTGLAVSATPYTGTITVHPANGDAALYSLPITVSLTITSATAQISAGPAQLVFSDQTNQAAPQAQLIQLTSTGQANVPFTVTTATTAGSNCPTTNWLTANASQGQTPAFLTVSVAVNGMTNGQCSGNVTVTYNNGGGAANTALNIPVTVNVSDKPLLNISIPTGFGNVTIPAGTLTSTLQTISLTSTDVNTAVCYQANANSVGPTPWLSLLGNSVGQTPAQLQAQISPAGLQAGTYNGQIVISSVTSGNCVSGLPASVVIPVMLTIAPNVSVTSNPASLTFTESQNGATPPSQSLTLTAVNGTVNYTTSVTNTTGCNLLQVPASGSITGSQAITVSLAANTLPQNSYSCVITFNLQGAVSQTLTVPVTINVTSPVTVSTSVSSLSFASAINGANPVNQTFTITSTPSAVPVTVGYTSTGGNWLTVTPSAGSTLTGLTTPQTYTVSVNPAGLAPGTYTGSITVTSPGVLATPITIPVTLVVSQAAVPQPVLITNNASNLAGAIAPGELITIKGSNLGPATPVNGTLFSVTPQGTVANTLAGVQVLFDGIPGTPIYVSASQINVTVPYEIAGRISTNLTVSYGGGTSAPIPLSVTTVAPAIYTAGSIGTGQGAIANQNGSFNGPPTSTTTPAIQNTVIAVYMTGGGLTNPASVTGGISPTNLLLPLVGWTPTSGTVTATINGVPAQVQFAGAAPGLVTGVIQVNVLVPDGVSGNNLPIAIKVNGVSTQAGVTVAVQ